MELAFRPRVFWIVSFDALPWLVESLACFRIAESFIRLVQPVKLFGGDGRWIEVRMKAFRLGAARQLNGVRVGAFFDADGDVVALRVPGWVGHGRAFLPASLAK